MSISEKLKVSRDTLKSRHFEWRGIDFKVRIPTKQELEVANDKAKTFDQDLYKRHLDYLLDKFKEVILVEGDQYFALTDDEKRNLNEVAKDMTERDAFILMAVNFLILADPDDVLTIDDMDKDLSKNDQLDLVNLILDVIKGQDTRKN